MGKRKILDPNQLMISEAMRKLRVLTNLSQQNLADCFAITRSTYTYYETGKTLPNIMTLKRLAEFYQIPLDGFFDEEFLENLGKSPVRPHKKVAKDPRTIGELTPQEKSLILALRMYSGSQEEALAKIRAFLCLPGTEKESGEHAEIK